MGSTQPNPGSTLRAWHSEERARLILESVQDAIFMLDPEGRVESWNAGAERTEGWRADEILGQHFSRFYLPEDVASGKPAQELQAAATQGRFEDEGWRVRKDGSRFWASVVITAMRGPAGRLDGFAKVTRDLTERKRAEEALERYRLLVDTVQDYAILRLDPQGIVSTWNRGAERIKGWRADEIVGQHFRRFYLEEDVRAGKPDRELEIAARDGRLEDDGWRVRKDGSRFWANVVITALRAPSGELRGFAKITRDLSERRDAEQERYRRTQAEEALRLRDEFLSIVAHELKTPLTALHLELQSTRRRLRGEPGEVADRIGRAIHSAERLGALIGDLLRASRLASGRFELRRRPFALDEAVRDVMDRMRETAARAGTRLELTSDGPVAGRWDPIRIEQVVTNLLSNAIKYGAGAPVLVHVSSARGEAVLTISDGGPGIPPEALPRIFGRFERAVSVHHFGGLGLGLYVAREIVNAHGGSVTAENVPDSGARLTVRLPLGEP